MPRKKLDLSCPIYVSSPDHFGTAGCIVRKHGRRLLLTCRHVVESETVGVAVRMVGRCGPAKVGVVWETGSGTSSASDYALIEVSDAGLGLSAKVPGIGRISGPALSLQEITIGMKVVKVGAGSSKTVGEVAGLRVKMGSENPIPMIEVVPFYDAARQTERFDRFCRRGDSGAVVVSYDTPHRPIGMIQERGTGLIGRAYAAHFGDIQERVEFDLE